MLARRAPARGVTLVETMVSMAIFASLLGMAAPAFSTWLQNGHIRTAAEAIQNGLQLARATAVQRNSLVTFQLTSTLAADCTVNASGPNWVVSLDDPSAACDVPASDTVTPRIVGSRAAIEGSRNAVIAADQASMSFNGLGRRPNAATAANLNINISNPAGGKCVADGGEMRCLRVFVTASGQVQMCDPAVAAPDTRGC
jgi:type IV fimbrial biogenesis protein FimT